MDQSILEIDSEAEYNKVITGFEWHTQKPFVSNTYHSNDEVRILINNQDIITAPFESYLYIKGSVLGKKVDDSAAKVHLVNNAIPFLFDEIRYELSNVTIDKTKNPGITTTIKRLLSVRNEESTALKNSAWFGPGETLELNKADGSFTFCVMLKHLLNFAEDYRRVIVNSKQELILLRSATDTNAIYSTEADTGKTTLNIESIFWRIPYVSVDDKSKLGLMKLLSKDTPIHIPFRTMELVEYPTLPAAKNHSWTVKTSSQLEKPRFVILAFQTGRKNKLDKNMSEFDSCGLVNVKLYLNSQYFPYDNTRGDWAVFYDMFTRFQSSYYGQEPSTSVSLELFKSKCPLYVIDTNFQNETLLSGAVDIRIEFETADNVSSDTTAYCMLIYDQLIVYTPLTGMVRKM